MAKTSNSAGISAPPMRVKERPGIDSLTSAFHFVSPALVGATIRPVAIAPELWLGCIAFMAWGMASHALGAVQDVLADRQAQLSSIATA